MKITKLLAAMIAATALISSAPVMADDADTTKFTVVKEIPVTTVKDQHRSGTCWAFSSLGFLEAEILRNTGKTYDLAEAYVIYKTYIDRAVANVRMHGDVSWSQGGSFYDVLYCLKNYGMMPESAVTPAGSLYGDTLFNHSELEKAAQGYLGAFTGPNANIKTLSKCWQKPFESILEFKEGICIPEFNVCLFQSGIRSDDIASFCVLDRLLESTGIIIKNQVIKSSNIFCRSPECVCRIALYICINKQGFMSPFVQYGSKAGGRSRLTYAAFLIRQSNNLQCFSSFFTDHSPNSHRGNFHRVLRLR